MRLVMAGLVVSLLIAVSAQAQPPDPLGEQFQVNSYTTSYQSNPSVAAGAEGSFVVVWDSYGSSDTDTSYLSIQGQRFDTNGNPTGVQFQVNSYTTNYQWGPSVAADAQGNFVVAWTSYRSDTDTSYESVQAQRYDASGAPVGGQFEVNSYTTNYQNRPAVATDPQGNFVVVWGSGGSYDTDTDYSIQGQRYDASGAPAGDEFQVNSYTTSYQWAPSVAVDAQGDFVVVWHSQGSGGTDTSDYSIQGQRYDASGTRVGSQFQVNSYTTGTQRAGEVAADAQGNFVVVWDSYGSPDTDTDRWSIQGQRYDASGTRVGSQFQVNSYTTNTQWSPAVTASGQGNFVVSWYSIGSYGTDTGSGSIQGQRYDASGAPVGGEFQVNSYTTNTQWSPAVASDVRGNLVVIWGSDGSYGTDTSDSSIQGQRYAPELIFADDFESGDTSAWSATTP